MPGTTTRSKFQQLCTCRGKIYVHQKERTKDRYKRKRQVFVHNPEEEIWHEPYMQTLRHEFSDQSILCDSKIELPWKDIVLTTDMKIRPDMASAVDRQEDEIETKIISDEKRESTDAMTLPWQDLLVTEIPQSMLDDLDVCDSSVEIPWADLTLEKSMAIQPQEKQICATDDVEIPWDEILVPRNIVIKSEKKRRHPSSNRPPHSRPIDAACVSCGTPVCCAKIRAKNRQKSHAKTCGNVPGSTWMLTCM